MTLKESLLVNYDYILLVLELIKENKAKTSSEKGLIFIGKSVKRTKLDAKINKERTNTECIK